MKKRKVSAEKDSEYKESSTHPSVTNLRATDTSHQEHSRSTKSSSIQNLDKSHSLNNLPKSENDRKRMLPNEMQPKTRFNSRDRSKKAYSTSSPRLKSFPAEKIKKLDNQPIFSPDPNDALIIQDPRETYFASSSNRSNNGQGDELPAKLSSHQPSKDTSDTDQLQVIANHQQICQTNPHSENLFIRPIASPENHPFVSNKLQGTIVDCNRSLQNPSTMINQPAIIQTPSTQVAMSQVQQSSSNLRPIIDQNRNETSNLVNENERQSIGGQNAINHKQIFIQPKQAAIAQDANTRLSDRCANNCQNVYHAQLHNTFQQNPRQINEQTQHNAYRQILPQAFNQMQPILDPQRQHLHNNSETFYGHYNPQLSATQVSGHGMTSPQDMTVSQMRLLQHNLPVHNQNLGYPVNFQSAWPQNNRWIQTTNQQHLHQQFPQQWQYYHQDTNLNQKESRSQDQFNPSQNHKSTNRQSIVETYSQQNDGKRKLQFTPDMIRDQELLVSTMRQQGIPEEVMRRQFSALLNEQQKHLIYLAQFQQQEDIPDIKKIQFTQKRIEKEEKPEWMMHITPPRISYNEIERIKAQQVDQKKQYLTNNQLQEEVNRTMSARQHDYCQQKKQEINDQTVLPQQMYVRMNPHQLWQQQMINWPYNNKNHQISCGYTACNPYSHQQNMLTNTYHQTNPTFNKYIPYNIRYNPYYLHSEQQKIWHKEHNQNSSNSNDSQIMSMDSARFEQNERPVEPSSLLKMRMYKEVVRPQKRNNGLQDPDTIQKVLETLKNPSSRKGLEYLTNITKKKHTVKLNGVQNSNEIPEDMRARPPVETSPQPQKNISANGLENKRNPNHPTPCILRPKTINESAMMEYPRQRQNARIYSMQAEKENGAVAINGDQKQWNPRDHAVFYAQNARSTIPYRQNVPVTQGGHDDNIMAFQYANVPPQHYHQTQQYYLNGKNLASHNGGQGDIANMRRPDAPGAMRIDRPGGDIGEKPNAEGAKRADVQATQGRNEQPEIRETRTIGGITYLLARKPECAPNNLVISPDKLIASRHLQPPKIF